MVEGKLRLTMPEGDGMQFVAESGSGHAIVVDDAKGHSGAKPIELALLALGACTGFDVISILRKSARRLPATKSSCLRSRTRSPPLTSLGLKSSIGSEGKSLLKPFKELSISRRRSIAPSER